MGNETSRENVDSDSDNNQDETNRRLQQRQQSSTLTWEDLTTAAVGVAGVAAAAGLTYAAVKGLTSGPTPKEVIIAVDATDKLIGGFCLRNIQSDTLTCLYYAGVSHEFGNDPTTFERKNVELALRHWQHSLGNNHVRVHCDNTGAIHFFQGRILELKTSLYCNSLSFEYSQGDIRTAADQLSRNKMDSFITTLTRMYPDHEINFVNESSEVLNALQQQCVIS